MELVELLRARYGAKCALLCAPAQSSTVGMQIAEAAAINNHVHILRYLVEDAGVEVRLSGKVRAPTLGCLVTALADSRLFGNRAQPRLSFALLC